MLRPYERPRVDDGLFWLRRLSSHSGRRTLYHQYRTKDLDGGAWADIPSDRCFRSAICH